MKRKMVILAAAICAAAMSVSAAALAQPSDIERVAKKYGAVGVQVAVIKGGTVADTYAWGWATKNTDPMTTSHKLRVASLSKVVLGMLAMRMAETGTVDLDAPIGGYWGATFPRAVTSRSILSHTSAITLAGDEVAGSYESVKARLSSRAGYHKGEPGWGYNNYAFGVLGMTLELAAQKTADQLLKENFFTPLGIDAAFEPGRLLDKSKLCTLYQGGAVARSVDEQRNRRYENTPGANGRSFAGGLTISAADLAKLVAVLAGDGQYEGHRLLKEETVALMERKSTRTVSDGFYQCLPLRYRENLYGRAGLFYHTGSAYGVYACLSYDPITRDGAVVLTIGASGNRDGSGIYAVCGEILRVIYQAD